MLPMQLCEHIFHNECLQSYLKTQISESKFPLHCPDMTCKVEMSDLDLKELLSEEDYAKFSTFSLSSAVDM